MNNKKELLTDLQFKNLGTLFNKCVIEHENQINKWGIQTHTVFEWLAYATEELGELSNAISEYYYRDGKKSDIVNEAIQTATLCLKIAEMHLKQKG